MKNVHVVSREKLRPTEDAALSGVSDEEQPRQAQAAKAEYHALPKGYRVVDDYESYDNRGRRVRVLRVKCPQGTRRIEVLVP